MPRALLGAAILAAGGCGPSEDEVRQEIQDANYCNQASECVNLGSHCPFGCYVVVNAAEQERIQELIADYEEDSSRHCMADCIAIEAIACQGGRCVTEPAAN